MSLGVQKEQVDEALAELSTMLGADGYELKWDSGDSGIVVNVVAGADACADCLVPQPVMEAILGQALEPVGVSLERVVLPAHA